MTIRAVHHINCATMHPVAGRLLGEDAWRGTWVAHCLVIETARDGIVLVDTGFGTRDIEHKTGMSAVFERILGPALDPSETALAQVAALGLPVADVRHIVLTHLDIDHAGGLVDFPNAKVHVHAREHAAAMARASFKEQRRYLKAHWAHGPKWEVYAEDGDTWRGLPAIAKLRGIDADIGLLPLHGHTRGHSAVIVNAGERWLVHAGDAYYHHNQMERGRSHPIGIQIFEVAAAMDDRARKASLAALRQLHESYSDLDIFCAHNAHELSAIRGR